jgi:DNA polymerase III delta subunit
MSGPNLFLITGSDDAQIRIKAEALARQHGGDNPDPFSFEVFAEQEGIESAELVQSLLRSLRTPAFFGTKTLWLQNFSAFDAEPAKTVKEPGEKARAILDLAEAVADVPAGIVLILSGSGVDARKGLFKACQAKGEVHVFKKPEVTDRRWDENMGAYIVQRAAAKELRLGPGVADYLVGILGTNTGRVEGELEKLWCYGNGAPATLEMARALCQGDGESISWEFTGAMGNRDPDAALLILQTLINSSREGDNAVIGIVTLTANLFRDLLKLRVLLRHRRLSPPQLKSLLDTGGPEAKDELAAAGFAEIAKLHPFRAQMMAQQALNYSEDELGEAVSRMRDLNLACVSGSTDRRAMLEETVLRLTARPTSRPTRRS